MLKVCRSLAIIRIWKINFTIFPFFFFADSKGSTPLHYVAQFYITSNPDDEKMDNVIESIDVLFKDEEKTEQVQGMYKT